MLLLVVVETADNQSVWEPNVSVESIPVPFPPTERTTEQEKEEKRRVQWCCRGNREYTSCPDWRRQVCVWAIAVFLLATSVQSSASWVAAALMSNPAAAAAQHLSLSLSLSLSPSGPHQEVVSKETPAGRHMRESRAPSVCVCVCVCASVFSACVSKVVCLHVVCVCFHHKHLTHAVDWSWTCNSSLSPSVYRDTLICVHACVCLCVCVSMCVCVSASRHCHSV